MLAVFGVGAGKIACMDFTNPKAGLDSKHSWVIVSKRLDHGSNHPTKPLRALARTPTGRDDAVLGLVEHVSEMAGCF